MKIRIRAHRSCCIVGVEGERVVAIIYDFFFRIRIGFMREFLTPSFLCFSDRGTCRFKGPGASLFCVVWCFCAGLAWFRV